MMERIKTEIVKKYGIADKNGDLLHIHSEPNGNAEFCNEYSVSFTTDEDDPLYLVDSLEIAAIALVQDMPWHNSSDTSPMHGDLDLKGFHVVAIEQTLTVSEVSYPHVLMPQIHYVWDIKTKKKQTGCVAHALDCNGDRLPLAVGDVVLRAYELAKITRILEQAELSEFDCPKYLIDLKRNTPSLIYFIVELFA